jgi:hypothetical protein
MGDPAFHAVMLNTMSSGWMKYPMPKPSDTTGPNVNSCHSV